MSKMKRGQNGYVRALGLERTDNAASGKKSQFGGRRKERKARQVKYGN